MPDNNVLQHLFFWDARTVSAVIIFRQPKLAAGGKKARYKANIQPLHRLRLQGNFSTLKQASQPQPQAKYNPSLLQRGNLYICIYNFLVFTDLTWLNASSHLPLIGPNGKTGESEDGSADLCTSSTIIWSKGCGHSLSCGVATPLCAARTRPLLPSPNPTG